MRRTRIEKEVMIKMSCLWRRRACRWWL